MVFWGDFNIGTVADWLKLTRISCCGGLLFGVLVKSFGRREELELEEASV